MATVKFETYPDLRDEMLSMYMAIYNTTDIEEIIKLVKGEFYGNNKEKPKSL